MDAPINPYASPQAELSSTPFAEDADVLQMPGMRVAGIGLSLVCYGIVILILSVFAVIGGGILWGM
jgi:hypothetical protein